MKLTDWWKKWTQEADDFYYMCRVVSAVYSKEAVAERRKKDESRIAERSSPLGGQDSGCEGAIYGSEGTADSNDDAVRRADSDIR